jgi:hypothetical protein
VTEIQILHAHRPGVASSGKRIPAIINKRSVGYIGLQQAITLFINLRVASGGNRTITVVPGAMTGTPQLVTA